MQLLELLLILIPYFYRSFVGNALEGSISQAFERYGGCVIIRTMELDGYCSRLFIRERQRKAESN